MIPANVLAALRQRFDSLVAPVTIDYFHQSESGLIVPGGSRRNPCPACAPTKETLEDLVGVSGKLRLALHEFHAEPLLVERWGVERVPAIILRRGSGAPPLRFYGLPGGHLLQVLVEAITAVSRSLPPPPPALAAILDRLAAPLPLTVVGSMRHPAAAQAAATAYQLSLLSAKVDAAVVELDTFPDLVAQLGLRETPATIIAGAHGFSGVTSPAALAQFALDVQQETASPAPPQVAPGSAVAIGGGAPVAGVSATRSAPAPTPQPAVVPAGERVDVAIVGGGPAGLQAALVLVRARKSVAVFDAPAPARNAASHGVHNFLALDGAPPAEIARIAWEQIDAIGGASLRREEVAAVERASDGDFVLTNARGAKLGARHVILAFGHRDALPDIPGFAECWGGTIISCPFCDGYEHRDRAWGLVVPSVGANATSPLLAQHWTDRINLFLGAGIDLPDELATQIESHGIGIHRGEITAITHEDGKVSGVTLDGGERVPVETLLWVPETLPAPLVERLVRGLGLAVTDDGFIAVNPLQQTNVERLWAAGDAIASTQAIDAARSGGAAAMLIVQEWYEDHGH